MKNSNSDKINHSKCDKIQKFKLWQNSKTLIQTKLIKILDCEETQKLKLWLNQHWGETLKIQIGTKPKILKLNLWQNQKKLNCDKTQIVRTIKNSNCHKLQYPNCDQTQEPKLQQNLRTLRTKTQLASTCWINPSYGRQSISRLMGILAPIPQ